MRAALPIVVAVLGLVAAPSQAQASADVAGYVYVSCGAVGEASVVEVVGAPCSDAQAVAAQVVAQPPAGASGVLLAAGWTLVRAQTTSGGDEHDLVATRPAAALRIRRPGPAPDVDGWEAGRELIFARKRLVGGRPVPSGAVLCTSSWLVRVAGGALGGLSAAHCGGLRSDRTVHRHNVVLRRPPQDGIVLGRVRRILTRSRPLDALLVPVPGGSGRTRMPLVDRGVSRPPWIVAGLAQATAGRGVCFAGRTSGADLCGSIVPNRARAGERLVSAFAGVAVRCTSLRARQGDSGGPVYTSPGSDGRVRAVGIVTLILLPSRQMCFTPLAPVLDGLHATLVTGAG
jgi:hypothetical protein